MIFAIAKNEFLQLFKSHNLTVAMLLCCMLMPLSVFIMLFNYDQRYENFTINRSNEFPRRDSFVIQVGQKDSTASDFDYPERGRIRQPSTLSIFAKGIDGALSGTFILAGRWLDPVFGIKQERNVFASFFGSFDLLLVVKFAVGLLAIILGCTSIVSEREAGTLALIFTNRIGRAQFIIGKIIGGVTVVSGSYIAGLLLCLLILIVWPSWSFAASDFVPVIFIFMTFTIYVIFNYLLGMTISCLCQTTTTASIAAVGSWLLIIVLLPMLLVYCAEIVHDVPASEIVKGEKIEAGQKILDEAQHGLERSGGYDTHFFLPNYMGEYDATVHYKIIEAVGVIEEKHLEVQRKQINLADLLLRFAPSGALANIVTNLTETSPRSYLAYKSAGLKLRDELYKKQYPTISQLLAISRGGLDPKLFLWDRDPDKDYLESLELEGRAEYFLENTLFDHNSRPWKIGGWDEYDFATEYKKYIKEVPSRRTFSIADFTSLLLEAFFCFGLTFCLIMRYDVRVA